MRKLYLPIMFAFGSSFAGQPAYYPEHTAFTPVQQPIHASQYEGHRFLVDLVQATFNKGKLDPKGYQGVTVNYRINQDFAVTQSGNADADFVNAFHAGKVINGSIDFTYGQQKTNLWYSTLHQEAFLALVGDHDAQAYNGGAWQRDISISRLISPEAAADFLASQKIDTTYAVFDATGNRVMGLGEFLQCPREFLSQYPLYYANKGFFLRQDTKRAHTPTRAGHAPRHATPTRAGHVTSREISELLKALMTGTYRHNDPKFARLRDVQTQVLVGNSNYKTVSAVIRYYEQKGTFAGLVRKITNTDSAGTQYVIYPDGTKTIYPDGRVKFVRH